MIPQPNLKDLLPAIRGAPVTCLIALMLLGGKASGAEVAAVAGYDEETARKSLIRLEGKVVARAGRYNWQVLSQTWLQFPLLLPSELQAAPATGTDKPGQAVTATGTDKPGQVATATGTDKPGQVATATGTDKPGPPQSRERGNPALPLKEGRKVNLINQGVKPSFLPSKPSGERGNPAFPPEAVDIADLLYRRSGYPAAKSLPAIQEALAAGRSANRMRCLIILWSLYATGEQTGQRIKTIPGFIASRVLNDWEPPPYVKAAPWSEDEDLLRRYQERSHPLDSWRRLQDFESAPEPADAEPEPEPQPQPEPEPLPDPVLTVYADRTGSEIWNVARDQLRLQMTKGTWETWVRDTTFLAHDAGTFIIGVPNAYAKDWLTLRLRSLIKRALAGVVGREIDVVFTTRAEYDLAHPAQPE